MRARVALHEDIEQDLASDEALTSLGAYTLFPKLVELGASSTVPDKAATLVCVVVSLDALSRAETKRKAVARR